MKPTTLATPVCPLHDKPLSVERDKQGLWSCVCHAPGCVKAGYGWDMADAYLDFHKANGIKPRE